MTAPSVVPGRPMPEPAMRRCGACEGKGRICNGRTGIRSGKWLYKPCALCDGTGSRAASVPSRDAGGADQSQTVDDIRAGLLHGAWDDREWLRVVSLRRDLPDDVRTLVEKAKLALGGVTP